jgi:disulfide bond formation protein DsbB
MASFRLPRCPLIERHLPLAPALFAGISAVLLLTVFLMEHVGGYWPCPLCWVQRYIHFAGLGFGLFGLLALRRPRLQALLLALLGVAYLVSAGYAAFHVGVEGGYFGSACSGSGGAASSIDELRARLMHAPRIRCDEVQWSLLGVSLAGWNGIVSLALAGLAFYAAALRHGQRQR